MVAKRDMDLAMIRGNGAAADKGHDRKQASASLVAKAAK